MRHPWRSLILAVLFVLLFALALFASPALAAPPPEGIQPQPNTGYACDGSEGVYVYDAADWQGACIRYTSDDPEFGDADNFHDIASSIKFVGFMYANGRARATLYEHAYYSGAYTTYSGDDNWLGDDAIGNDRADSIRIEILPFCDMVTQIPTAECEALVALYNSTFGPYWTTRTGWLANYTPCSWFGVTCEGGHVSALNLFYNNLAGSIPSSLGSLSNLILLQMGYNNLTGAIPSSLGNLTNVRFLDLCRNDLTGPIPSTLGNLTNLGLLYLFNNTNLTGPIPSSLGNLTNLSQLWLHNNDLTGPIPASLGNLTNLTVLYLSTNNLTGPIPSTLGNLTNLQILWLHNNDLTGPIPASLGNLSSLLALHVYSNPSLSGALPQSLKNLTLRYFSFYDTNLCEPPDASFQAWLASIPNLQRTNVKCAPTATPTRTPQKRARLPIVMKNYRAFGDDNFSATTLNARWWWINPDSAKWSLTARPGFLRILTSSGGIGSKNLALQNAPLGDYTVQTRLLFTPTSNYQIAGIAVYKDSANYLMLGRCYCNLAPPLCRGNAIYFDRIEGNTGVGSNFVMTTTKTGEAYLRLVKRGNAYTAYYSENGSAWTLVGAHTVGVALPYVGLTTGQDQPNAQIPADFDYFDISPPTN